MKMEGPRHKTVAEAFQWWPGVAIPLVSGVRAAVGVSPFNLCSGMGDKRSKVTETDLWKEEGPKAEPWDGGVKYDAVMTKDGFIYPSKEDSEI